MKKKKEDIHLDWILRMRGIFIPNEMIMARKYKKSQLQCYEINDTHTQIHTQIHVYTYIYIMKRGAFPYWENKKYHFIISAMVNLSAKIINST